MLKHIFATTALATLLAAGAYAQTAPAADPAQDPAAPVLESEPGMGDATIDDGAATTPPMVVEDGVHEDPAAAADPMLGDAGEYSPVDLSLVSADRLMGVDITTFDGQTIASIDDVIITDDGQVESVVARFGGFLGFGTNRVLLTMDEIEIMQDANENLVVRSALTPENIENRPAYES